MVNAGVARVVWLKDYPDRDGVLFLQAARMKTNKLMDAVDLNCKFGT